MIHWDKLTIEQAIEVETYIGIRLFEHDFEMCLLTLDKALGQGKNLSIVYPLLRDAIVTYGRPFSGNRGERVKRHILKAEEWVPAEQMPLHNKLIKYRNTLFAHTDIIAKNPNLGYWEKLFERGEFVMNFKATRYEELRDELPQIHALALTMLAKLREKLKEYEEKFEKQLVTRPEQTRNG
jgi:hypothetical protein